MKLGDSVRSSHGSCVAISFEKDLNIEFAEIIVRTLGPSAPNFELSLCVVGTC